MASRGRTNLTPELHAHILDERERFDEFLNTAARREPIPNRVNLDLGY